VNDESAVSPVDPTAGRADDARGLTQCPKCETDCDLSEHGDERPLDWMVFVCTDCNVENTVGIVWFPDESYEAVCEALESDEECDKTGCSSEPTHRYQQSVDGRTHVVCADHVGRNRSAALDLARREADESNN